MASEPNIISSTSTIRQIDNFTTEQKCLFLLTNLIKGLVHIKPNEIHNNEWTNCLDYFFEYKTLIEYTEYNRNYGSFRLYNCAGAETCPDWCQSDNYHGIGTYPIQTSWTYSAVAPQPAVITVSGNKISWTVGGTVDSSNIYITDATDKLNPGQKLELGQKITSLSGGYSLLLQDDGNLVLYHNYGHGALWASNTGGQSVSNVTMQTDGNLVIYNTSGSSIWSSGTGGNSNAYLIMQNDGNAVIYTPSGIAIWATNTEQYNDYGCDTSNINKLNQLKLTSMCVQGLGILPPGCNGQCTEPTGGVFAYHFSLRNMSNGTYLANGYLTNTEKSKEFPNLMQNTLYRSEVTSVSYSGITSVATKEFTYTIPDYGCDYNGNCVKGYGNLPEGCDNTCVAPTVTPTMTPTVTPTVTPTITPTVTPTVTPTIQPLYHCVQEQCTSGCPSGADCYTVSNCNEQCGGACVPNWQCEQPLNGYEKDGCGNRRLKSACNQTTDGGGNNTTLYILAAAILLGSGAYYLYSLGKEKETKEKEEKETKEKEEKETKEKE